MAAPDPPRYVPWSSDRLGLALSALAGLAHLALAGRYDLFRDELYFIVCGQHPAFGYADQPPLVPLIAAGLYELGGSAFWVRLPSVVAAAALVFVTVRFARSIGGGTLAAACGGLAVAMAPVLLGLTAILSTSSFDPLAFTLIAFLLWRGIAGDDRALVWAGVTAGIILQVKYSLVLWAAGLAIGIVLFERGLLRRKALWLGLGIAAAIAAPSVVWQALHGFPFLELSAAAKGKNTDVGLGAFLANQLFIMNPLLAPLWIAGLVAPFAHAPFRPLRFLVTAYAVTFVLVRLGGGKDYYLAALYPAFLAIGAVWLGGMARAGWRRSMLIGGMALAAALSAVIAPLALPVLSPDRLEAYIVRTGLAPQAQERSFAGTVLPQVFADQLGWHAFTEQVGQTWLYVTPADRARTAILTDNYGEAAALDLYGARFGLPPALSGHNHYYLLGLRGQNPQNLIVITDSPDDLRPLCTHSDTVGRTWARFAVAHENDKAIVWCQGLRQPLALLWPRLKHYR